jgi:hypothetical protein
MPISYGASKISSKWHSTKGEGGADKRRFLPANRAIVAKTPGFTAQTAYQAEFSRV